MISREKLPLDILSSMSYIKDMVMGNQAHIKRARRPK